MGDLNPFQDSYNFMDVPLDTGSRCRCKLSPENPTVLTTVTPPVGEELLGGEHFS
jgi:hypothetical protein